MTSETHGRVDAVGFDFDHTLGLDHKVERGVGIELLGASGERAVDLALCAFRYGARALDDALGAIGIDPVRFRTLVLQRAPDFVEPVPGAPDLLRELEHLRVPIALLSNGWSPLQEVKAKLVGFKGPVIVSEVIGARKPSLAAFRQLEGALAVPARHIAYVGDDPVADVCGALSAGMQAVWFDWEGRTYPQDVVPPTARVSALAEVVSFVQGPQSQTANPLA